ncbi:MAG: MFS transporter [Spirochaetes bacterium]|nr:MFS transporter [Spirochaetota bacterium]
MREHRKSIVIFLGVTFLFWLALYLYVPTLPTYVKTKTADLSKVGLVLSMYGLLMVVFRLPVGIAADAAGWGKPFIIGGLFFGAFGAFAMGKGKSLSAIAVGRAFTGISAATWVPLLVVFSSFFSPEEAIFSSSMLTFTSSFGRMVGTSLTGVLNRAGGYVLPFNLAAATGILAICIMVFTKVSRSPKRELSLASIVALFLRKDVVFPAFISIFVHYAEWSVTLGFLPILAQDMGANDMIKSLLISLNILSIAAANLLNTFILKKVSHFGILSFGVLIHFTGIVVIALSPSLAWIYAGTMMTGFAFGLVYPILLGMSIHKVEQGQRSTAMGIHQALYSIGMFTGPWITGIIADFIGIRHTFLVTAGFFLMAVCFFIFLLHRNTKKSD